jgi:hypothetical protein
MHVYTLQLYIYAHVDTFRYEKNSFQEGAYIEETPLTTQLEEQDALVAEIVEECSTLEMQYQEYYSPEMTQSPIEALANFRYILRTL